MHPTDPAKNGEGTLNVDNLEMIEVEENPNDPFVLAARKSKLFNKLSTITLNRMALLCPWMRFEPGDYLTRAEHEVTYGYLIESGTFHIVNGNTQFKISYKGRQVSSVFFFFFFFV
jgi:hypothetical protein